MTESSDRASRALFWGAFVAILALCVFQAIWAIRTKQTLEEMKASLARLERVEAAVDKVEEKIDRMAADQDVAAGDIPKLERKIDHLAQSLERRDRDNQVEAPVPEPYDWTQPQLFEKARVSCAEYGIELTKDEVRVPSRFVIRQGAIEYFAVLKGGKEHETLISLLGNVPRGERRPKDFGARLNNAIQAIGFKRGKPVNFSQGGHGAPSGEVAHLFVEWEEKGQKVLARAEDLVWNRIQEKPMERGKFVYVGSTAVQGDDPTIPMFAADVTGEVVSTYTQSPDTMFDNASAEAFDDSAFLSATPRIPADVEACTLVIRRIDREPTKTFPDPPKEAGDDAKPAGTDAGQGR